MLDRINPVLDGLWDPSELSSLMDKRLFLSLNEQTDINSLKSFKVLLHQHMQAVEYCYKFETKQSDVLKRMMLTVLKDIVKFEK